MSPSPARVLSVYLTQGQQGDVPLVVTGTLAAPAGPDREMPLPHVEVLDVARQQGDVAVQADPAFDVRARGLAECQEAALGRLAAWLDPKQREAARLALHYARPDYQGTLRLVPRVPDVSCDTISNVRVTDRAVEETIFLNFSIQRAGIRELSFLLPDWMTDARITVPMLRQKSIEPVAAGNAKPASGQVRVRIELQDDVMNAFRILVENDRLLTPGGHTAPIPVVETGRTNRQYVTLETAGRDEVLPEPTGLEPLGRQQREWQTLSALLGNRIYQAYLVTPGAERPRLAFKTVRREDVKTAGRGSTWPRPPWCWMPPAAIGPRSASAWTTPASSSCRSSCRRGPSCGRYTWPASRPNPSAPIGRRLRRKPQARPLRPSRPPWAACWCPC